MTWVPVQDTVLGMGTGTSNTFAYASSVTAGHLLMVLAFFNSGASAVTFGTISDSQGNTWTQVGTTQFSSAVTQTIGVWVCAAKSSGPNTVSLSWSAGSANGGDLILTEWSGLTGSAVVDGTPAVATPTVATVITPSYTPGVTGDLVVNMVGSIDAISAMNTPWTNGDNYAWKAGVDIGVGSGGTSDFTGAGWGWTTGATSPITPNAVVNDGSNACLSIVFGIQASGISATQILEPTSDITATGWTPSTGSTLFGVLGDDSDADWASATLS